MRGNGRTRWARWSPLARLACAGLASLAAPAASAQGASAAPPAAPIALVEPDAAPFSSAELTEALLARLLSADAGAPQVRVSRAGEGAVSVQVGDRSRLVTLGERTGPAAARVVALVIADLAGGAFPAEPVLAAAGDAVAAAPAVTVPGGAPPSLSVPSLQACVRAPQPRGPVTRLSVVAGALIGTRSEESSAVTVDADVALPLRWHALRLVPSAGIIYEPTRNAGTLDAASLSAAVARLLGGWSWLGAFDFLGGPFVEPYSIAGANPHTGVLFGAEALARLNVPLGQRARMVVAARADVYADRVRVHFADDGAFATPRLALGLGWGLGWDWWP